MTDASNLDGGLSVEEFLTSFEFPQEEPSESYLDILIGPLKESHRYVKREMPQADLFADWFGLNSPLVLEAKTRAGLVTSIYRQIGLGCERLLLKVVQDNLGVPSSKCSWAHIVEGQNRSLDACVPLSHVTSRKSEFESWVSDACRLLRCPSRETGAVFEVRQGHKSGDSKRQVGDRLNAAKAITEGFLPVMFVFSTQLPRAAHVRYQKDGWLVLTGCMGGGPLKSSYAFFREVLGFDLAGFMERHQDQLKALVQAVVTKA